MSIANVSRFDAKIRYQPREKVGYPKSIVELGPTYYPQAVHPHIFFIARTSLRLGSISFSTCLNHLRPSSLLQMQRSSLSILHRQFSQRLSKHAVNIRPCGLVVRKQEAGWDYFPPQDRMVIY